MYEFLVGVPPFHGADKQQVYENILHGEIEFEHVPEPLPPEAIDLMQRLLRRDPCERIKPDDIKSHPFFHGIDWDSHVQSDGLFLPELESPFDTSYFDARHEIYPLDKASVATPNASVAVSSFLNKGNGSPPSPQGRELEFHEPLLSHRKSYPELSLGVDDYISFADFSFVSVSHLHEINIKELSRVRAEEAARYKQRSDSTDEGELAGLAPSLYSPLASPSASPLPSPRLSLFPSSGSSSARSPSSTSFHTLSTLLPTPTPAPAASAGQATPTPTPPVVSSLSTTPAPASLLAHSPPAPGTSWPAPPSARRPRCQSVGLCVSDFLPDSDSELRVSDHDSFARRADRLLASLAQSRDQQEAEDSDGTGSGRDASLAVSKVMPRESPSRVGRLGTETSWSRTSSLDGGSEEAGSLTDQSGSDTEAGSDEDFEVLSTRSRSRSRHDSASSQRRLHHDDLDVFFIEQ
eukprot:TRINITY_DN3510_c0_g1_i4.p1 TRINITY_DN3510_c0_g1~~TRINITY_DN3510_c0_g1_i4.p1  ORF type:complete len:464 (+),score=120.96 TRINITY_DN3510_c0_g1_i4:313-1704(+)